MAANECQTSKNNARSHPVELRLRGTEIAIGA